MSRHERLSQIAALVIERGALRVEDIVENLDISAATARRDLDELAAQQLIVRTRGGASAPPVSGEIPIRYRTILHNDAKERIAKAAAALVLPGDTIGLNGGTTTTLIGREIALRCGADKQFGPASVTVVTNAINIANELVVRPQLRVVVTGGVVRPNTFELTGPLTALVLPAIAIDTLFLGLVGLEPRRGAYNDDAGEAMVNGALVENASRVVAIADSSKLGRRAFAKICDIDALDMLITDAVSVEQRELLENSGVEVVLA
ncbi:MAG: DeoR/GlpR family DNA-binding transcription regulator [Actinomycetaceae bacterium]|nr:DeoR/GlpR family DNA-binding transcription regulator [Actinomycetaceae bacterium]